MAAPISDSRLAAPGTGARPVPAGPRAYRSRLRSRGPLVALIVPGFLGLLAWLLLHGSDSTSRGIGGFVLAVLAAPALLVAGAPLEGGTTRLVIAAAASALLWLLLGTVAGRRATRRPAASWRDYWPEYLWLLGGVWVGVVVSLAASNLVLGSALL